MYLAYTRLNEPFMKIYLAYTRLNGPFTKLYLAYTRVNRPKLVGLFLGSTKKEQVRGTALPCFCVHLPCFF